MGVLNQIDKRLLKGLSVTTVRLLTGEPEPEQAPYAAEKVVVPVEYHQLAAKAQVHRKVKSRAKKPKRRG